MRALNVPCNYSRRKSESIHWFVWKKKKKKKKTPDMLAYSFTIFDLYSRILCI